MICRIRPGKACPGSSSPYPAVRLSPKKRMRFLNTCFFSGGAAVSLTALSDPLPGPSAQEKSKIISQHANKQLFFIFQAWNYGSYKLLTSKLR
jgi:hypothetical protein